MSLTPELTDGAVRLRAFRREDAPQLHQAVRESLVELKPWMSWAHDGYSLAEAETFIQITRARWEERTLWAFAIAEAATDQILGGCSLSHKHPAYHLCNVGYWVRSSRHGQGIAGRAVQLAARYGFQQEGIIRAEVVVAVGNERSRRVAEKIGAHHEGVLRNRMVVRSAVWDAHMYSIIPQDYGLTPVF